MLELKDGFIFYHGSYCEVKEPDLTQCAKRKDFGQGFYLTTSVEHDMEKYDVIAGKIADDATNQHPLFQKYVFQVFWKVVTQKLKYTHNSDFPEFYLLPPP